MGWDTFSASFFRPGSSRLSRHSICERRGVSISCSPPPCKEEEPSRALEGFARTETPGGREAGGGPLWNELGLRKNGENYFPPGQQHSNFVVSSPFFGWGGGGACVCPLVVVEIHTLTRSHARGGGGGGVRVLSLPPSVTLRGVLRWNRSIGWSGVHSPPHPLVDASPPLSPSCLDRRLRVLPGKLPSVFV